MTSARDVEVQASVQLHSPAGVGEIGDGSDLAAMIADSMALADGDIVVVTSKAISKAEGLVRTGDRDAVVRAETVRVVARRGPVRIVENPLGLVMAAGGVDASNLAAGSVAVLPRDPDGSARRLRDALVNLADVNVAVVLSDTAGRAWRRGQTDMAIGVAGMPPSLSLAGTHDPYGNELAVTEPAVADEVAAAAELSAGKLTERPWTRVRGLAPLVLPRGQHGPGARALIRPRSEDLFALGTREAVVAALAGDQPAGVFGPPASPEDLVAALSRIGVEAARADDGIGVPGAQDETAWRCALLARAHAWSAERSGSGADSTLWLRPDATS